MSDLVEVDFSCQSCGADLKFAPGTTSLKCPYCGGQNDIPAPPDDDRSAHAENDFFGAVARLREGESEETVEVSAVRCSGCGADVTLPPEVKSEECAFCGTTVISDASQTHRVILPQALLPFYIAEKDASGQFTDWLKGLWFAPNKLKKMANSHHAIKGVYVPHWTFDAACSTDYTGQRGDNYTETYRARGADGKMETRTRTKTRWSWRSGRVFNRFDDILIPATDTLPRKYVEKLEPWDLPALVPFRKEYLSGFRSERYQTELEAGFEIARSKMEPEIDRSICWDIGGDKQRITSKNTHFEAISFKHILLPVWISAYRYKDTVYRFVVNARTGEVQGERPWSAWKIAGAVLAGATLIAGIVYFVNRS